MTLRSIKRALDCIKDVRTLQSEIHLIKSNAEQNNKDKTKICMRRGVLMSMQTTKFLCQIDAFTQIHIFADILQQASLTLPLWVGEIGQSVPPLCGCIQHIDDYICKTGDKVAARVRNQDEEENWILAEVVSFSSDTDDYVVDDIDSEYGQERYTVTRELVVPLPLWRANPLTDIEAIFPKDAIVLALYPQTTCFYRGIVSEPPRTPQEDYLILFEDSSYLEGYSPPLSVAQLYVVAYKDIQ
jgi:SAGA-associated factor 29